MITHVYLARATVQGVLAEVDLLNIAGRQVKQIKCLESVLLRPGAGRSNSEHFLPSVHKLNQHGAIQTHVVYLHWTW